MVSLDLFTPILYTIPTLIGKNPYRMVAVEQKGSTLDQGTIHMMIENRHLVFLRGINVGGARKIAMGDLRIALEQAGMRDVRTILASGNVSVTTDLVSTTAVAEMVDGVIRSSFGFSVPVLVRSAHYLADIAETRPFDRVAVDENTRLYVTFLADEAATTDDHDLPIVADQFDCTILSRSDHEVFTVVRLSDRGGSTEAMRLIESLYGTNVTTRNWNTVQKLLS
jgi:uncharacterized protein (DUF1697 family)